jgi:putative tricarboxylic transport membrane protein
VDHHIPPQPRSGIGGYDVIVGRHSADPALSASFGLIGYVMEENGYPVAAMVLGVVMGTMVEQAFVTSLIKSDGSILPFFERPVLAACTIAAFAWPALVWIRRKMAPESLWPQTK